MVASEEVFALENEDTLKSLREKHPPPHPDSVIPSHQTIQSPIIVTACNVMKAIQSFPNGSFGGPDGLRPQHLKDLIFSSAGLGSSVLMESLTAFVNFVIRGDVPIAAQSLHGASLVAFAKMDGGVRPIAVACTLRRLVAKCAGHFICDAMGALLAPLQLGYGTPMGAEAAVHAART